MTSVLHQAGLDFYTGGYGLLDAVDFSNNSQTFAMGNYSLYFLSNEDNLQTNCSVYSLTSGSLRYEEYFTGRWSENITSDFLPAYYVTNCSITNLQRELSHLSFNESDVERWLDDYNNNPYNVSDNGDSFVAFLFMISGSCVSCWMLILLFLLSPNHKRKPIMTQIATGVYSIVLTILLAQVTQAARKQYYEDSLDMIHILSLVNDRRKYPIALIISQFLTCLAFFQLVVKMTKQRYKFYNGLIGACLILMYIIVDAVDLGMAKSYFDRMAHKQNEFRAIFTVVLKVLFIFWISVTLGYHTFRGTASSPRQVSYSRRLLPLAIFTWFMVGLHVIITILIASLWENKWLVTSWITFLPYLLEMYILTTAWEWFYSIRDLESRLELIGMLGRKISLDDVMTFSNSYFSKPTTFISTLTWLWNMITCKATPVSDESKEVATSMLSETSSTAVNRTPSVTQNNSRDAELDLGEANIGEARDALYFDNVGDERDSVNDDTHHDDSDDYGDGGYEVQYIDDDEAWERAGGDGPAHHTNTNDILGEPQEGSSRSRQNVADDILGTQYNDTNDTNDFNDSDDDNALPPFQPLPGFSRDDYWDDK
ncbi:uncharacterized protein CXQ87_001318 [Candidozyma duobushaemuli]|uniref:PH-response regulator protein palH/RIM21 n=2 Tax=Candidozyma TaxID=3303203 RepID=A0ABX8I4W5_9ASCO|nr:uncharacterized protein CXQ87_001318 [[Candida] duobushaemulonis]PVH18393.1 hypothetical protein CXQ87_001318 [[Candida] duobushaemulonis]QWU86930.1 hypothetical protein CA3LBN_001148 [[Candida] haemuloni]